MGVQTGTVSIRTLGSLLLSLSLVSCRRIEQANCTNPGDVGRIDAPVCEYPSTIISVLVSPANSTAFVGQTVQLTAYVYKNASPVVTAVVWSSSDSAAASVDSTGRVHAKAVSADAAICAVANGTGFASAKGCASVIVQVAPPGAAVITSP